MFLQEQEMARELCDNPVLAMAIDLAEAQLGKQRAAGWRNVMAPGRDHERDFALDTRQHHCAGYARGWARLCRPATLGRAYRQRAHRIARGSDARDTRVLSA